jgi:hypothetical protein
MTPFIWWWGTYKDLLVIRECRRLAMMGRVSAVMAAERENWAGDTAIRSRQPSRRDTRIAFFRWFPSD